MAERTCHNCLYAWCDPCLWLRWLWEGEPLLPRCANHPQWPGQLHEVPGIPCRNYRPRPPLPPGDIRLIPLGDGCYAIVDTADYEWLRQWTWHHDSGYAVRYEKGKTIYMHREILPAPKGRLVDHADGNKANNCRTNLRPATRAQNNRNRRKHHGARSIYKGVFYWRDQRKWYALYRYRGRRRKSGYFDTEIEAARAYDRQTVEWGDKFAPLNFPRDWPPERRAAVQAHRQAPATKATSDKRQGKSKKARRSDCRLRAGKTRPTRVDAELPTTDPKAPGHRRWAQGKSKKEKGKGSTPRAETRHRKERRRGE